MVRLGGGNESMASEMTLLQMSVRVRAMRKQHRTVSNRTSDTDRPWNSNGIIRTQPSPRYIFCCGHRTILEAKLTLPGHLTQVVG